MTVHLVQLKLNPGVTHAEVERALDRREDWFRYRPGSWLVVGAGDASHLAEELKPFYKPHGTALIARIDLSDINGWQSKEFWDWVARYD